MKPFPSHSGNRFINLLIYFLQTNYELWHIWSCHVDLFVCKRSSSTFKVLVLPEEAASNMFICDPSRYPEYFFYDFKVMSHSSGSVLMNEAAVCSTRGGRCSSAPLQLLYWRGGLSSQQLIAALIKWTCQGRGGWEESVALTLHPDRDIPSSLAVFKMSDPRRHFYAIFNGLLKVRAVY